MNIKICIYYKTRAERLLNTKLSLAEISHRHLCNIFLTLKCWFQVYRDRSLMLEEQILGALLLYSRGVFVGVIYKVSCRWQRGAKIPPAGRKRRRRKTPSGVWRNLFLITSIFQYRMPLWIFEQVWGDNCWFACNVRCLWSVWLLACGRSGAARLSGAETSCVFSL